MIMPANETIPMIHVMTCGVQAELTPKEIYIAQQQFKEKMKTPDPDNPNLWTVFIGNHKLWGILDEGAGPNGESVFTILFPSEY